MDTASLTHAFRLREIFLNYNEKNIENWEKKRLTGASAFRNAKHPQDLAVMVFRKALQSVVDDVIENGVQFEFPLLRREKKLTMYMDTTNGEAFLRLWKEGINKDFDPIETNCTSHNVVIVGQRMSRKRNLKDFKLYVHLDRGRRKRMIDLAKSGKNRIGPIKTYEEYVKEVVEYAKALSEKEVRKILYYGFRGMVRLIYVFGDIYDVSFGKDRTFFFLTGYSACGGEWSWKMKEYVMKKMRKRIKVLFKRLYIIWDGYYWFNLEGKRWKKIKDDYENGRIVDYGKVMLNMTMDNAFTFCKGKDVLLRIKSDDVGYEDKSNHSFFYDLKTDKAELMEEIGDKLDWTDIGMFNRKYITLHNADFDLQAFYDENKKKYEEKGHVYKSGIKESKSIREILKEE